MCKRAPALGFHYKLFQGKHVPDIVMTSAETSNVKANTQKADVIAVLKETCRELEARKQTLEELISTLEKEEDTEVEEERLAGDASGEDMDADDDAGQATDAKEGSEEASFHSASSGEEST